MSKKKFTLAERYAVWTAHGERCWLCKEPVSFSEVQVDHIIPEMLIDAEALSKVLEDFGLPSDFDLNGWGNWLPAHGLCNNKKLNNVFKPSPIIQMEIELSIKKVARKVSLCKSFTSNRNLSLAFGKIMEAIKEGKIPQDKLSMLAKAAAAEHFPYRTPDAVNTPIMMGPGLELISENGGWLIMKGATGMVGGRPKGTNIHSSFDCPFCGVTGWNGARCIQCGQLIDD